MVDICSGLFVNKGRSLNIPGALQRTFTVMVTLQMRLEG